MITKADNAAEQLATLLANIVQAETIAMLHDRIDRDRDAHARAAQQADEQAEADRRSARALIESAFPGVSWSMIERAAL